MLMVRFWTVVEDVVKEVFMVNGVASCIEVLEVHGRRRPGGGCSPSQASAGTRLPRREPITQSDPCSSPRTLSPRSLPTYAWAAVSSKLGSSARTESARAGGDAGGPNARCSSDAMKT
jgi:hypothetical protein